MPPVSAIPRLMALAEQFVTEHQGHWSHSDWEGFAREAGALGYPSGDEYERNLGSIVEGLKYFYFQEAVLGERPRAKAPSKRKPAAKKNP